MRTRLETPFHPSMGLFQDNRSDGLKNHHRAFQESDDIWASESSLVPFFFPPDRHSSVPFRLSDPYQGAAQQRRRVRVGVWQCWTEDTNIQGLPPPQWLLKLYLYHHHISSNPSTSASESETGLKPRRWSTLWKFRNTHNKGWPFRIWSDISVHHSSRHNRDVCPWGIISTVAYHMT